MDKENNLYMHNGILFHQTKKVSFVASRMEMKVIMLTEANEAREGKTSCLCGIWKVDLTEVQTRQMIRRWRIQLKGRMVQHYLLTTGTKLYVDSSKKFWGFVARRTTGDCCAIFLLNLERRNEYFHRKINKWGNRHIYPDLDIIWNTNVLNYHMGHCRHVQF